MVDQNTHINYSAEDIERYLKGGMSAKEMHDMEKAALKDPFLADAIEGYSNASFVESQKHLNEISTALQTQKEETKVVPLHTKSFYWWRVAAMIILVLGVGVVSWFIINSGNTANEVRDLARAKENKIANKDTVSKQSLASSEKTDTANATLLAQNLPESNSATSKKKITNTEQRKPGNAHVAIKSKKEEVKHKQQITDTFLKANDDIEAKGFSLSERKGSSNKTLLNELALNDSLKTLNTSNNKSINDTTYVNFKEMPLPGYRSKIVNTFNGRIFDNTNQPVPYATINAGSRQATTTDANGCFKLQSPDSLLNVTVSSIGFISANAELKNYATNNISIHPDNNALSEVAITGYSTKKQAKKILGDGVYPAGGWQSFQAYVYKKLKKPIDTTNVAEFMGDVQLEFSIDDDGDPYNFSIIKSPNDTIASRAIELVKDGPKWISTSKEKKGKVTIKF